MATEAMLGSLMEPELDLEGVLWMRVVDIRFCLPSTHSFTNKTPISFWRTPSPTLSVYGLLSSAPVTSAWSMESTVIGCRVDM